MAEEVAAPIEIYTDSFRFTVGVYGINVTFSVNPPHPEPSKPQIAKELAVVRMSLEQAKVLTLMLSRNLKNYERSNDLKISVPAQVYTQLGIAEEDW